ncbi:MAG TPA: WD40 repeat domain-containing protein [Planctomycetaceae bacterium]|nr:WD40 repeat domain-containing protein [Planctomycetaceae bacterium]
MRWILSAGLDGTIKEWSIADYEEIRELEGRVLAGRDGHAAAILSADFSADGSSIITAGQDRMAKTWDAERGRHLRTFREGHELLASAAVFFRDGRRIVTAAVDNTARVWDAGTGTELVRLDHTGRNAAVAVSPDGRWILTGSDRGAANGEWKAKLWDAATGRLVRELAGHRHDVTAVAFSSDSRLAATGDAAGRACLWDARSGTKLREFSGHSRGGHVTGIAFTSDGRYVLTASTDQTVATWDAATGEELAGRRLPHPDAIVSMALSPDGTQALTSCEDRVVRLWDLASAQVVRTLETGTGLVNAVDIAPDGRRALTVNAMSLDETGASASTRAGANDLTVRLWDLTTGREITYPAGRSGTPSDSVGTGGPPVAANDRPAHQTASTPGRSGTPSYGPFLDFKQPALAGLVWSAAFSPDGEHVVTVGGSTARLWTTRLGEPGDLANGRPAAPSARPQDREVMRFSPNAELAAAAFSSDAAWIVTGSWDGTARVWDRQTGRALVKLTGRDGHRGRINSAVFAPREGQIESLPHVLTAGDDGAVKLWRITRGSGADVDPSATVVRTFRADGEAPARVHQAAFSPDGTWVLAAAGDGRVRVWTIADGQPVVTFEAHQAPVLCAAFSADGRRILTGSEDSTAGLWDLANVDGRWTARRVLTLKGHTARVTAVAFSPAVDLNGNGRLDAGEPHSLRALTASADTTVKLWDTRVTGTRQSAEEPAALAEVAQIDNGVAGADGRAAGALRREAPAEREPARDDTAFPSAAPGFAKEILTLSGHNEEVTSVRFSPDGRRILTAGRDGRAILWLTLDWRDRTAK